MQHPNLILAQLNPVVGDIVGNVEKIRTTYAEATANKAALVITPELSLVGYPPEDLVLTPSFRATVMKAARSLAESTSDAGLVFGSLWEEGSNVYNAAILASGGRIQHIHYKMMLPNYGIFDESRIFTAGHQLKICEWNGMRIALMICEDIWHLQQAQSASKQHAELMVVINASPFEMGKLAQRKKIVGMAAQVARTPAVYVNMMGGQDDIVFDGGSFIMSADGYIVSEAIQFQDPLFVARSPLRVGAGAHGDARPHPAAALSEEAAIWGAMAIGLRDYVHKNGFKDVLIGLSGGIDSAVTAAIAVDAIGKEHVCGVLLPSPYTSIESTEDALALADNLGIQTDTIPITPMMDAAEQALSPLMTGIRENLGIGGNIQSRIRGQLLMAIANQSGAMLLSTGNKSEIAVGYTTLYGDSCGGYNVLKDAYKTDVYRLAQWRNQAAPVIPERSIAKEPSAELAPGQKDSDQLPDYTLLDQILALHIEGRKSTAEIAAIGIDETVVKRVLQMVRNSEHKRRQSCPGVKVSSMLFGRDRRFPITRSGE